MMHAQNIISNKMAGNNFLFKLFGRVVLHLRLTYDDSYIVHLISYIYQTHFSL